MNIKGQIIASSNLAIVDECARQGFALIYVGDELEMPKQWKFITATAFTPNYQAMCAQIEGDEARFASMYLQELLTDNAQELMAIILAALCKGTRILMYFPEESVRLGYPILLMQYMANTHGITVGDKSYPFMYNPAFDYINLRLMYIFRLVDWKEYILSVEEVDTVVLIRLREDLCPIYNIPINISDADMVTKVTEIKDQIKNAARPKVFSHVKEEM